jgi:hypothetical protein
MQDIQHLAFEESGVALISPCILFEWAMEFTEGPEILDFYDRAREALGGRLTHYSLGGPRKRLNKRAESLVPTWCQDPLPFIKKQYLIEMNGADEGATASSLRISLFHRPYEEPDPKLLERWRATPYRAIPGYTTLSLALPLDHPFLTNRRVTDWLCEFEAVANRRFISGSCGLALRYPYNFPTIQLDVEARNRVAALMQRHPGFDLPGILLGVGTALRQLDQPFLERHQAAKARPYLKRANWLTFLSEDQVDWIGGLAKVESELAGSDVGIRHLKHGICLQAGEAPQAGDTSRGDYVAAYQPVGKLVRPVRIDSLGGGSLPDEFIEHGLQDWLDAFDQPHN